MQRPCWYALVARCDLHNPNAGTLPARSSGFSMTQLPLAGLVLKRAVQHLPFRRTTDLRAGLPAQQTSENATS